MNEKQFIANVQAVVQVQNRKRLDAGAVLDREVIRYAKRVVWETKEPADARAAAAWARQVVVNEAVGVVASYSPITVEAVLDSLADTPT